MKIRTSIVLCALSLSVAGCTTSDDTPPGSVGGLVAEDGEPEEGEAEEGIELGTGSEEESAETEAPESEGAAEGGAEGEAGEEASQSAEPPEGEEPTEGESAPDPASMTDDVCIAFFDGAAPLAARAEDARLVVARGSVENLSDLGYSEITVMVQRLDELGAQGDEEQAGLIEMINAPFTTVERAVTEDGAQDESTGEVSYEAMDLDEAVAAQEEFTAACLEGSASN